MSANASQMVVDHRQFGLEETKANEIKAFFMPMLEKMSILENRYNEVIEMPYSKAQVSEARDLRSELVRTRTATAKIHKKLKEFYLNGGRFVDSWKNTQLMMSQGLEDNLKAIEDKEAIEAAKKIAELQSNRISQLAKYDFDGSGMDLGRMDSEVYDVFLESTKRTFEEKAAAEKKAEEARIKLEKDTDDFNSRKLELLKFSPFSMLDQLFIGMTNDEYKALLSKASKEKKEDDKKRIEQDKENKRLRLEKEAADKKLEAEKLKAKAAAEKAAKIAKDKEDKLKADILAAKQKADALESEKAAKVKEAERIEMERLEAERSLLLAGDKKRVAVWVSSIELPSITTESMDKKTIAAVSDIQSKFSMFKKWALQEVDKVK